MLIFVPAPVVPKPVVLNLLSTWAQVTNGVPDGTQALRQYDVTHIPEEAVVTQEPIDRMQSMMGCCERPKSYYSESSADLGILPVEHSDTPHRWAQPTSMSQPWGRITMTYPSHLGVTRAMQPCHPSVHLIHTHSIECQTLSKPLG